MNNLKELFKGLDLTPDKKIDMAFNQHRPNHANDIDRKRNFTNFNQDLAHKIRQIKNS